MFVILSWCLDFLFVFFIHLFLGGRQGKLPVVSFEMFDFETSRWRSLPDIPSKRVFALYTHSDTHIFSVGGLNQDAKQGFTDVVEVFDLEQGSDKRLFHKLLVIRTDITSFYSCQFFYLFDL